MIELAQEVRELRLKLHLTQEDLAALIGISWMSVHRWEHGRCPPPFATLALLRVMAAHREARERMPPPPPPAILGNRFGAPV
jgi:DNA-binding transcriptional regulator YiaG